MISLSYRGGGGTLLLDKVKNLVQTSHVIARKAKPDVAIAKLVKSDDYAIADQVRNDESHPHLLFPSPQGRGKVSVPRTVTDLTSYRLNDLTTAKRLRKQCAFTLAELLITLGIIGVVAVLTIPALVAHNQERGWNTAATVFERKLQESLKVMNTQSTLSGYNSTKDFVNELSRHMKIVNICDNPTDCFEDSINWEIVNIQTGNESEPLDIKSIKTAVDLGQKTWTTEALGVQFANGTSAVMAYNDKTCKQDPFSNEITGTGCISMIYDTSGYANPNTTGKDVRGINSVINTCVFKTNSLCFSSAFQPEIWTKSECIANGGTGYECPNYPSSWASANLACNAQGLKLPSELQLNEIRKFVYNKPYINSTVKDFKLDKERAELIGMKTPNLLLFTNNVNWYGQWTVYFGENTTQSLQTASPYYCGEGRVAAADSYQCQMGNVRALCVGNN